MGEFYFSYIYFATILQLKKDAKNCNFPAYSPTGKKNGKQRYEFFTFFASHVDVY